MIANVEKPKEWCGPEPNFNSPELDLMYLDREGAKLEKKNQSAKKKDVRVPFQALYTYI